MTRQLIVGLAIGQSIAHACRFGGSSKQLRIGAIFSSSQALSPKTVICY